MEKNKMNKNKIEVCANGNTLSIPSEEMAWFVREFDRIVVNERDYKRILEVFELFTPFLVVIKK